MKRVLLVGILFSLGGSPAKAQPARSTVKVVMPKSLPPLAKSQPMSATTRQATRDAIAAALKVPVASVATTVRDAVGRMADPTGLDVGTSVKFNARRWGQTFGSSGKSSSYVYRGTAVGNIWGSEDERIMITGSWNGSYRMRISLPTKPPSTPQAYTLTCDVVGTYSDLPPAFHVRTFVDGTSKLEAESDAPVTSGRTGWLSAATIVPPGPYTSLSFTVSLPEDADVIFNECEIARVY